MRSWHEPTRRCSWARFEAAARSLDAVREIMIEDSDLPIELRIKTEGVAGFAALAMNDDPTAVAAADAALRLTKGRRPTYFAAFYGYMGPAEVCLSQWEAEVAADRRDVQRPKSAPTMP